MKASVLLFTTSVAVGLTLPANLCLGAPTAGIWTVTAGACAQLSGETSARRAANDLLREARASIKRGDFERAEKLIKDAEKLGVKYDPLMDRWSDTPDSMRKLLAQERSKANAAKGGSKIPPLFGGKSPQQPAVPTDPVTTAPVNPQVVHNAADQVMGDQKSLATSLLKDARAALARGDKFTALAAWQKAAAINAQYGPNEDSPQRVADELVRAGIDPSRLNPAAANTASPYALRPTDINPSSEPLPQLGTVGTAPPAAVAPANYSPYNLPQETNPLARSGPGAGGAFQPGNPAVNMPAGPPNAAAAAQEPQRLPVGDASSKAEASRLVSEARVALDRGDLQSASRLAEQAEALNVPDNVFGPGEIRPWQMTLEVNRAMVRRQGVIPAGGTSAPAQSYAEPRYPVAQSVYNPAADTTQLIPASTSQSVLARSQPLPVDPTAVQPAPPEPTVAQRLFQEGVESLQKQDRAAALAKFNEAWKLQDQLDPETRQQLKDKLTYLRAPVPSAEKGKGEKGEPSPLEQVNSQQELLRQKLVREILNEEKTSQQLAQKDPKGALANLKKLRERVAAAQVEPAARKQLLTMVDRMVSELQTFIEQNKATIEAAEQNKEIKAEVVRDQEVRLSTQNKLADMVEQFNKLMDEKRYAEAEVIARQANDIAPSEPVVTNMIEKSKLAKRIYEDLNITDRTERGFNAQMLSIGEAGIPFDDRDPYKFSDAKTWKRLSDTRRRGINQQRRMTPVELEIQKSLSKGVEVRFVNRPLSEIMDTLGRMAGINVYLDPQGLNAEGVTTDTPVTLNLTQPISLKSALNLVLSPLGLSYVIQNEVLRITSEQTRDSNVYAKAYYVADLVMPIPNFVPNSNMGLPGAIREGINAITGAGLMPRSPGGVLPLTIAKDELQQQTAPTSAEVLAQINNFGGMGFGGMGNNRAVAPSFGPGGVGGAVKPDFDSLVELITSTIAPQSWQEVGGPGAIQGYENNLSLVVSQTQEVHEALADLLEQLRRLQDLQVTIEVRFITLADNFFERIGVDFQLSIDDNTGLNNFSPFLPQPGSSNIPTASTNLFDDNNRSISIGWTTAGPTGDLDVKFNQGSFAAANPQFGGFDPDTVGKFGFAILSDIEAFFVVNAGQGDSRANILQAPKVTLFNGQLAFVSDTTNRPFVTSVIPVVGDFAAAQQPVIVVLNEGTSLSVQAVVSADRRFVRLTMVPFFSQIGDVQEFTFNGTTTTDSGSVIQDPSNPKQNQTDNVTKTVSGTTVQLPTFAFTTVTTTVSVPDGGTVLLGGIKRLREGRTERGVPILNKLPYISRLFKNVGIGREAQSLMMMVTPRIIIQEEEEQKLGIEVPEQ